MKWTVLRRFKGPDYTIGSFYIDGKYFSDTLEDTCRIRGGDCSLKVYGATAIPEGRYAVEWLQWAKHENRWYPHILAVPCFTGILIHSGVTAEDTYGCLLLGENKIKGQVINGLVYMEKLRAYKDIKDITIEVI
jgi:hypothetical protein